MTPTISGYGFAQWVYPSRSTRANMVEGAIFSARHIRQNTSNVGDFFPRSRSEM
jgi:hypothetical protein